MTTKDDRKRQKFSEISTLYTEFLHIPAELEMFYDGSFYNIIEYLKADDCHVLNNIKPLPPASRHA